MTARSKLTAFASSEKYILYTVELYNYHCVTSLLLLLCNLCKILMSYVAVLHQSIKQSINQ